MPAPKPTLGYRSITDAIMALRGEGLDNKAVAECLDLSPQATSSLYSYGRRAKKRSANGIGPDARTVVFPVELLDQLVQPAVARRITPNELARRIVEVAVDDGLIDSILDDLDQQET